MNLKDIKKDNSAKSEAVAAPGYDPMYNMNMGMNGYPYGMFGGINQMNQMMMNPIQ